jgi:hypothetical protein
VATAQIQATTGQRFIQVTNDTVTLRGGSHLLWLPERPVTAVGAVTTSELGVVTTRVVNVDFEILGASLHWLHLGTWPRLITVTYSHGYATASMPQMPRGICLAAAGRLYDNPQQLRSETIGQVSWTAAGASDDVGPGLTAAERSALRAAFAVPVVL